VVESRKLGFFGMDKNSEEPMYFQRECNVKPLKDKMHQGIIHWQLNYFFLSEKPMKVGGERG